jgi:hypothetical protein
MYTKGKWTVRGNTIFIENTNYSIATIHVVKNYEDITFKPIEDIGANANAKLIAAAPDMFEALKRVEAYLVANEDILAPFPTRSELDNIRAAMFKTGLYKYE